MSILFSHFFEKINQISPLEADFTEVLDTIALKPKMLYFYGKMPQNVSKMANPNPNPQNPTPSRFQNPTQNSPKFRPKSVAIVGSRHNTRYGHEVAYNLAYALAQKGVIIVSGLAFGIDSIGHRACLDAGGTTVAVLGTPIDQIYPREHLPLAAEIIKQGGCILSEYAPRSSDYQLAPLAYGECGFKNGRWYNPETAEFQEHPTPPPYETRRYDPKTTFLYRNRLISALSDIVVVVEAAERSGSLNTATHALEQGKEVFAVPGNITSPYSQGCNKLIAQGAHPYTCPEDILRLLFPDDYVKKHKRLKSAQLIGDTDIETLVLQALATGIRDGEGIMAATHLPPEVFNQAVTLLEIKGRVRPLGANHWSLC